MEKSLQNTLALLGLSTKEMKFFISNFKLGLATINEVAKHARLERSTAYLIAQGLIDKGFIEEDFKEYGKKIYAAEPKKLLRLVSAKQRNLRRNELELEDSLPDLQALYQASEIRPKVRVFQGNNGLLSIWEDILSQKEEILLWTNQETETLFFNEQRHKQFIKERVRKQIPIRVLAVDNEGGKALLTDDPTLLRKVKLLPKGVQFSAETYIYGNKIAILDYKKDIIGINIESEPITATQRAIFEMNWNLF